MMLQVRFQNLESVIDTAFREYENVHIAAAKVMAIHHSFLVLRKCLN